MTLSIMRKTAAVAAAAVLTLGLTACGSSDDSDGGGGSDQSSEAAAGEAMSSEDSSSSGGAGSGAGDSEDPLGDLGGAKVGGSFSGTVDNQPLTIEDVGVACLEADGNLSLAATPKDMSMEDPSYPYVTAVVDSSGSEAVMVSIFRTEEETLSFSPAISGDDGTSAEVTKDGSTYVIKGEARQLGDVTSGTTTPFDLSFTCP